MTGKEYQTLAMRTNDGGCFERLQSSMGIDYELVEPWSETMTADLINGVMGLCGESGEFADIVKKLIFHKHPIDINSLKKELGDVMWYVAMCCNALNISLDDVMQGNIDKLKKRYPDGFSTDASINREEYQND